MKVLFDTNVLLDVLLDRKPFSAPALRLLAHVESGGMTGYLCATTVTTVHYLATRALGRSAAREEIEKILRLFEVAPVNRLVLEEALYLEIPDYEDAVLAASAHHMGADSIVSRDTRDFKKAPLPVHSPEGLLHLLAPRDK